MIQIQRKILGLLLCLFGIFMGIHDTIKYGWHPIPQSVDEWISLLFMIILLIVIIRLLGT